jgi:signal transduction histidine kinase
MKATHVPKAFRLRGQGLRFGAAAFLLALTPVVTDLQKISELSLDFSDFSLSDPVFDLLLLLQTERRAVHDLRKANEREKSHVAQLAMASRLSSLGEMSAGIAHEINNPLAIIQMACEQFLENPDMPTQRAVSILQRAQNASLRIAKIIHGLRLYARDGSLDGVGITDAAKLIDDTLEICRARFRDRGIDLLVSELPEGQEFECNSVQISQVLMNLLSNAFDVVESLPQPWVRIDFSLNEEHATFRVSDSGPEISENAAKRMMQPFFTTKPPGKGTGLGLPISLGIAEAHGGKLFLDRGAPQTTFVLELPRRHRASEKST